MPPNLDESDTPGLDKSADHALVDGEHLRGLLDG